ncbi:Polycomb group protein embryonic flower [Thalictrum thalictroides]|uniref:Polycomb group protein embryonic flower n=1 Tax=Thalictrum thalictroides TaxID=46969 RepID=A0A7J6VS72_THATH|nr:Polycomb group protein embryonic flower [Thalictrum thalictroides]
MPGLALSPHGITNPSCNCSHSRTVDSMCRQDSRVHLSAEDAIAAEESLSVYCKPVELYNILGRRSVHNPSFLQRCLSYKIQEKHKRRIKMTISLSWTMNKGVQVQNILPLYVLLVTPVPELAVGGHSAAYCCRTRARILTCNSEFEKKGCSEAKFVLPEKNKLLDEHKFGKFFILLISCGDKRNSLFGGNLLNGHMDTLSSPATIGGYCLWGKIPMESLSFSWEKCASLSSECGPGMLSTVDMRSCFLESSSLEKESCITFKTPDNPVTMQVRVNVFAQDGEGMDKSPYSSFTRNSVHTSSLPHIMRMRTGNAIFNYKYYNNTLQKTEVTEDFSCPFCLVKCASFKGLRYHLCASHDLFNFEFWVTEDYQAVNVFVKSDIWRSEIVMDGVDPKLQTFFLCCKVLKRKTSKKSSQNANHVYTCNQKLGSPEVVGNGFSNGFQEKDADTSLFLMPNTITPMETEPSDVHSSKDRNESQKAFFIENDLWNTSHTAESAGVTNTSIAECLERVASSPNVTGVSTPTTQYSADPECPLTSGCNHVPAALSQLTKSRKVSSERSDPRNRTLLQKRQFFHSHRAQPMALEQVLSDRDSEDEVDDDIADFEDRRMLDDFVDVTKDEKKTMHLWNSFVRKQRVLADGHIPWACEAFTRLHGRELLQAPALFWCWRLFMIKLWNHSLLDGCTMDICNRILEGYSSESIDCKQREGRDCSLSSHGRGEGSA